VNTPIGQWIPPNRPNLAGRTAAWGVTGMLVLLLCDCSTFNRAWRKAEKTPVPADSIEGRWEGRWLSEVNGHTGALRCLVSRDASDQYAARFRATYLKVQHFSYTVPLQVERHDGEWQFTGEEDLGWMAGGVYRYAGMATPTNFDSTYESGADHGTFEMGRP
jgi:hypothetical protein